MRDFIAVIGLILLIGGILLIIGNVSGMFPTFSYAGYISTLIGGFLMNAGSDSE